MLGDRKASAADVPLFVKPDYTGIDWSEYFDVAETDNFVTNLWNCGKWVKLVMARGCYWRKCAFCDVKLPYIGCFKMPKAADIVDCIEEFFGLQPPNLSTRQPFNLSTFQPFNFLSGVHFVDEAMPPALVSAVCDEILRRKLEVAWWGNIRFDNAFTPALSKKMARAGCIAVTGGLECANDRLLKLMNKGITCASAEKVLKGFRAAKIFVHAYLMYDFPTETKEEQKGAERYVKSLAKKGLIQSCFWHRFALTVHSPIAREPEKFGIIVKPLKSNFARNELEYVRKNRSRIALLSGRLRQRDAHHDSVVGWRRPYGPLPLLPLEARSPRRGDPRDHAADNAGMQPRDREARQGGGPSCDGLLPRG